jgi:hypothetical protein
MIASRVALIVAGILLQTVVRPAVPTEPIDSIIQAFRSHNLVALGEGNHNNEQGHAFRMALIRDRRFANIVNDIVVEFGNARDQAVVDRFIAGDDVADVDLRRVWQDTTAATTIWDVPIYEEFFRAVRAQNATLKPERRLRVLLGDPPIDWNEIRSREDMGKWLAAHGGAATRDEYPAAVIRSEVLARHRRALIVYGDMHLQRKNLLSNYSMEPRAARTLVSTLESDGTTKLFTVWTNTNRDLTELQANVPSWPRPSLTLLKGNTLGATDFAWYYPDKPPRLSFDGPRPSPVPISDWRTLRMEEQFDALLYLGTPADITLSRLSQSVCTIPGYLDERIRRLAFGPPGSSADTLKQFCADPR